MKIEVFKFLNSYSTNTLEIDRIIVSTFLYENGLDNTRNNLLRSYLIQAGDDDYDALLSFQKICSLRDLEELIKVFEFVISPSDKIVNGAVYTPEFIREYIVKSCLEQFQGDINSMSIADLACGCGGFLLSVARQLYNLTDSSYYDIFKHNIFGVDIADYSIERTKILLSLFAVKNGEEREIFEFNLCQGNSLELNWTSNFRRYDELGGFDIVVGNPPYVCSRNMSEETLLSISNWEVSKTGHPDLYIPFFQLGYECLTKNGVLGFITVNTFTKSINGRALRKYFSDKNVDLKIISFGGEQLFPDRNTYTCICFLSNNDPAVKYIRIASKNIISLQLETLVRFPYSELNNFDGWNLTNDRSTSEFLKTIESVGKPFKDVFKTKNGIATLKNDVFKFTPLAEDGQFYYFVEDSQEYAIERNICRDIINANKIRNPEDINLLREKIIFPYDQEIKILAEMEMRERFPNAFKYLKSKKSILSTRDKGQREYEKWYAFGRRQSMDIRQYKLFFPHICDKPVFTLCSDRELLFYNGLAIVSDDMEELKAVQIILSSQLFLKYIKNNTKDYASGYISMSRNYLKNFGVPHFTQSFIKRLLNNDNVEEFLAHTYNIEL
ncbi:HsdM family class I SAM-dependent methyltransferase [Taibaiella soli]|uniref:site-specific DNA-methyltransferase (adenine-specific) n=1 Tax=Taibaiella soli TaxID=1649169 RepID=A0A2W2B9M6_9BACT|nr:N-6 DNA methylase [Taibaiella soli]PZF72617.1 SAM-dependent DNA methyltransferase [Taibaiella soli]